MNRFLCLIVCFLFSAQGEFILQRHGLPPVNQPAKGAQAPTEAWISQFLDNFNTQNSSAWSMRYMYNSQHFRPGGPMFVMIGGEWEITPVYLMTGAMYDMAAEHGGYMFYTEHRFYGQSVPNNDVSDENLKYLTSDQALADLDAFVKHIKSTNPDLTNSKVVVYGGSYAANLAVWFRLKYPDSCDMVVASSAPILAVTNFYEYHEAVARSLETVDVRCVAHILSAFNSISDRLQTTEGTKQVMDDFNWCTVSNHSYDNYVFFKGMANMFAGAVQYSEPGDLDRICAKILSIDDPYSSLNNFIKERRGGCFSISYLEYIQFLKNLNRPFAIDRQWFYQTCNEFGYIQSSDSTSDPFGDTFPHFFELDLCRDVLGKQYTPERIAANVNATNTKYGGKKPPTTRVVFINGQIDPWHRLSAIPSTREDLPSILVKSTSHCADLFTDQTDPEMIQAQQLTREKIAEWLKEKF